MNRPSVSVLALTLLAACSDQPISVEPPATIAPNMALVPGPQYIATPAGTWHRSCVHEIPKGARVEKADGNRRVRRADGTTFVIPPCAHPSYPNRRDSPPGRDSVLAPTINGHLMYTYDFASTGDSWRHCCVASPGT